MTNTFLQIMFETASSFSLLKDKFIFITCVLIMFLHSKNGMKAQVPLNAFMYKLRAHFGEE